MILLSIGVNDQLIDLCDGGGWHYRAVDVSEWVGAVSVPKPSPSRPRS